MSQVRRIPLLPIITLTAGIACGNKIERPEYARVERAASMRANASAAATDAAAPAPMAPLAPQAAPTQRLIRTAELRVEVKEVARAIRLVENAAQARSALLANTRLASIGDKRHDANLVIRVPAARFDDMLASLRQLGDVAGENISADDITKAYADLETRLAVKEETVARLRGLLASRTAKLADVLEVERELGRAVTELEQMKGERRYYDHQVAMSSISLTLFEPAVVGRPQFSEPCTSRVREVARGAWPIDGRGHLPRDLSAPVDRARHRDLVDRQPVRRTLAISKSATHLAVVSAQEVPMKKKGRPNIPDFSRKRPTGPVAQGSKPVTPTRGVAPGPIAKPQATSAKSGRRGS